MLKYFTRILVIIAATVWTQVLYAEVDEKNLVQDVVVNFIAQSWNKRDDILEPHRSRAIEQIEAMKNQQWKGLGNFFFQLLDISEAGEKATTSPAIVKQQTEDNSNESIEEIMKELFIEILLTGAKSSEEPILEEKFKNAIKMKFYTIDDFGIYCVKVYEKVTGRTSPNER